MIGSTWANTAPTQKIDLLPRSEYLPAGL